MAEASLAELAYCLHASHRLGYIDDHAHERYRRLAYGVGAPLAGLVRAFKRDADGA